MSTNINSNLLMNFISKTLGTDKLSRQEAARYGVDKSDFSELNTNDNNYLEIYEMLDSELYEKFASMYQDLIDEDNEANEEKEKEEANKVKGKEQKKA